MGRINQASEVLWKLSFVFLVARVRLCGLLCGTVWITVWFVTGRDLLGADLNFSPLRASGDSVYNQLGVGVVSGGQPPSVFHQYGGNRGDGVKCCICSAEYLVFNLLYITYLILSLM